MDSTTPQDRGAELQQRWKNSLNWMRSSFYTEWEQAFKAYKCLIDQPTKENKGTQEDPDRMAVAMPDTWSLVRRQVARITAQPPNLKVKQADQDTADKISRKLMRDWDRGGVQRQQKKHVTQAAIFGWSVRGWHWSRDLVRRSKRVDPFSQDPNTQASILKYYAEAIAKYTGGQGAPPTPGQIDPSIIGKLVAEFGKGGLLPLKYDYLSYEGPRSETLFIGDCFPEPNFQELQTGKWFMVRRRRKKAWLDQLVELYPELGEAVQALYTKYPKGTPDNPLSGGDDQQLRRNMLGLLGRADSTAWTSADPTTGVEPEYTIFESHEPGVEPKLQFLGETDQYIGEIDYPYELEGRIAFTDLVLIDDIMSGIGDSHARMIRGLQRLHERQTNARMNLVYNILRPLVWVSNRELYEQPEMLKRGDGFRMFPTFGPNDIGVLGEQAALAAAASGLNNDGDIQRLIQQATGESNMSMSANVDPQQGRTATGARLMAYNQDILTKDANDAFTQSSLNEDSKTMYLLNRSEMPEAVEFDAAKYVRTYDPRQPIPDTDLITVAPEDFQHDDTEVTAEAGSTLADDDDAVLTKAQTLFQTAMASPQLFNVETARNEYLIAMGKGRELQQWIPQPAPPPPPPPDNPKIAISMQFEKLAPEVQQQILLKAGLAPPAPPPPPPAAGGPPGPGGSPPKLPPAPDDSQQSLPMGGAQAAAEGHEQPVKA